MQGEDDLRGLAKIMAFMRAVSILLVLMHLLVLLRFLYRTWLDVRTHQQNIRQLSAYSRTVLTHPIYQIIRFGIAGFELFGY